MTNIRLHLRRADYQLRRALSGLQREHQDAAVIMIGHAIAAVREVRSVLESTDETAERMRADLDVPQ